MDRERLMQAYREGFGVVAAALDRVGARLDEREASNEWSPREIVHHLADSEMTSAIRLRRLIAEDEPIIAGYDEQEFARRLFYDRPVEASLAAVKAARDTSAQLLERLSDEQWARTGVHTESGAYGVETWLEIYARHCHDHAEQMLRAVGEGA